MSKLPEIIVKGRPYSVVRPSVLSFKFIKAIPPHSEIRVWLPDQCTCRSRNRPCEHIKKALEIFQSTNTLTIEEADQKLMTAIQKAEHDKSNEAVMGVIVANGIIQSIDALMGPDNEEGNE
jgi:hypothetical protein